DFVTRRRKKGEQNAVFRKLFSDFFNQRSALLKLTQRCTMYPDVTGIGFNFFRQFFPPVFSAINKMAGFFIKKRRNFYTERIKQNSGLVKQFHRLKSKEGLFFHVFVNGKVHEQQQKKVKKVFQRNGENTNSQVMCIVVFNYRKCS